jgi:putative glutamine amidotransferase
LRPLIGVTTSLAPRDDSHGRKFHQAYAPIAFALERAGGLPVLIPSGVEAETLREIYNRVDGVLLPGGGDIDPSRYAATPHPQTHQPDENRDFAEITVARWAIEDDRPLLGICRGHQLLNVALGGRLIQDIPSQLETPLQHDHSLAVSRTHRAHDVRITPESRLAQIMGQTEYSVNSLHHQCVETPGEGLVVTSYAPDGIIESVERPDKHFVLSVQWHPEDMDEDAMNRLFRAFVEAAQQRITASR